jgi:hypothetical protein
MEAKISFLQFPQVLPASVMPEADLCSQLKSFYAAVRSQKGDLYSKKSMISIRYVIQKHFLKIKNTDVVNNDAFKPANLVFRQH